MEELAGAGFSAKRVSTSAVTEEILEDPRVRFCVLDYDMAEGTGPAVLQTVARRRRDIIPVVLSGATTARAAIRLFRLGAGDVVLKPVNGVELAQVLNRLRTELQERRPETPQAPAPPPAPPPDAGANRVAHGLRRPAWASPDPEGAMPPLHARFNDITAVAQDLGSNATELIRIAEADPALASRVLRTANSAWYRGPRPYTNIRDACVRLGNRQTLGVLMEAAYTDSFRPGHPALHGILERFRRVTVIGARTARFLAVATEVAKSEELYAAALLHNIGELAMLWRFGASVRADDLVTGDRIDEGAFFIEQHHEEVGAAIIRAHRLPPLAAVLAQNHHTPRPRESAYDNLLRTIVLCSWATARAAVGSYLPTRRDVDPEPLLLQLGLDERAREQLRTLIEDALREER